MASFEKYSLDLDCQLLREGSVTLYHKHDILNTDVNWLEKHRYEIISFDIAVWKDQWKWRLFDDMEKKLKFSGCFGMNLNALNECMLDLEFKGTGKVLVFMNVDMMFLLLGEKFVLQVLDILEMRSRWHLLFGNRLITLLQSNDPGIHIQGFGAGAAMWNHQECSYKDRGITEKDVKVYEWHR